MNDRKGIRFLGTGAGDCVEMRQAAGRTDTDPRKAGAKDTRHAAGLFIAPDILVDRFSPERLQACGVAETAIRHLLVSHGHEDHFQPRAMLDLGARLPHPVHVHASATVCQALDFAATHHWDGDTGRFTLQENPMKPRVAGRSAAASRADQENETGIRTTALAPGDTFALGDITGTAVLANHMIDKKNMIQQEQALNFVLERDGRVLFYGLDSSYPLPESMEMLCGYHIDIAIMDATFGHKVIDPVVSGHHNFAMLEETITQFRQRGVFTEDTVIVADHISYDAVEPHEEIVAELADKGIVLAYDGMTLDW